MVWLVIGVILMGRDNRHGRWILGLSMLFIAVFILVGYLDDPTRN
jgi:uncharacterized membrane protein YhdT